MEAGLGFDAAMSKVSEKWNSELSLAFARVIQEIQLGKLRREALRDMADRIGLPELTSFVAAVIQSELLGVSMAKVLRIQSDQMRIKRRQHAEEEAHKAPIKMLIPMGLLIFPSLMIVLLTPAALKLMHSLSAIYFNNSRGKRCYRLTSHGAQPFLLIRVFGVQQIGFFPPHALVAGKMVFAGARNANQKYRRCHHPYVKDVASLSNINLHVTDA